ncbi:2-keto-4-pentenoate hydratase 2 [Gluconacetobacter sp. SXCC-1]|uniref:2-keto-4-pentenoate hydratase n=1 Tax=Komagataeibacter rhaeticus TaxID=215221 RepID=A0A181C9Y4_9PROT|nr:fumarylacetoacetate hydrolase family protein [Komagataeibacter rhaeticus]ATU73058.1 2-keto-4-pentenoate hydratase [Komagataeibacter xylinus]EGG77115.1 2-keto-4-pentenoate hydratase 2 [Gluconacetobacter sp. SXCC-1]QIP35195.1 2-keto-4-pentenoate hydratase [Komagataeibacter rhaeticus]QOC47757.1 fumarylacetoacetate hydrolase family protein [Komagataeibacter rhaeticus]WPP22879.1 fumarylacetoacetate hydrolase family protein [Komagataeibacter rhaeticus]
MPTSPSPALTDLFRAIRAGEMPPPATVDPALVPATETAAYAVQDAVGRGLGPIVGWKVGASGPEAEPAAAPIHAGTVFGTGATVPHGLCRHLGVEGEIGYRFARALPARPRAYARAEVLAAIGTIHPVIEIVDTRFEKPASQHHLLHLADQQSHGALIVGPGQTAWQAVNPVAERVVLSIDGRVVADHTGGNAAGDPLRLLVWLANHAARRGIGIGAGCLVTTGSATGTVFVAHGTDAEARFPNIGQVTAHLA